MRNTNQFFTGEEYQTRLGIWLANKRFVNSHNSMVNGFSFGLNHLAHLTPAEYKSLLGYKGVHSQLNVKAAPKGAAPDSIDWRDKGVVNPVKDQGQCGSCWAFSAIQAFESAWAIGGNTLISLSEQNIVDCVTTCDGCNGGLMDDAYTYVIQSQGGQFNLEADYPYKAQDGSCEFSKHSPVGKISSFVDSPSKDENALKENVGTYGPLAIAIDASSIFFQLYSGGIYDPWLCSSTNLDHGVGAVGYGTDGKDYWLVRNSWGGSWGEKGYIRMVRNKSNKCGVATQATLPKL